jgi:hypothetical protein
MLQYGKREHNYNVITHKEKDEQSIFLDFEGYIRKGETQWIYEH